MLQGKHQRTQFKNNALFNLINPHPHISKVYLYYKDLYETKYQLLIKKRESVGLRHCNDSKALIEYSNNMDINQIIDEYNPNQKCKMLNMFDDLIAVMLSNKNFKPC